jgi:hypothetical protein
MARAAAIPGSAEQIGESFPLIDKLGSYLPLSPVEVAFLRDVHGPKRRFDRHRDIIAQGRPYGMSSFCAAASPGGTRSSRMASDSC